MTDKINWWILWKGSVNLFCQEERANLYVMEYQSNKSWLIFFSLYTDKSTLLKKLPPSSGHLTQKYKWGEKLWASAVVKFTVYKQVYNNFLIFCIATSVALHKWLELLIFMHVTISQLLPKLKIQGKSIIDLVR